MGEAIHRESRECRRIKKICRRIDKSAPAGGCATPFPPPLPPYGVSRQVRTFIVYELQFRDGSGLIQFNGTPGELYARRHLVPRCYMNARTCVRVRARARGRARVSLGTRHREALLLGMLNDNGNNNNNLI